MTNVKQVLENPAKKRLYSDLAAKINEPVTSILEKVTARLNQKGFHSERTNRFTYTIVLNIYYGKYTDYKQYVEMEMREILAEKEGLKEQLQPHFDAIREALAV